jgi:diguanylate cyclase (GGDEF)-like protein
LLVCSALASTWYVRDVNSANTATLTLRDELTDIVGHVRNEIWAADAALYAMLISPQPEHAQVILTRLSRAKSQLDALAAYELSEISQLQERVGTLQSHVDELTEKAQQLIQKRRDTNWVYPILPYISNKLLEPNIAFETAADQALREIADSDGKPYASSLFGHFDEIRDLWRRKILNFRAVVIRFAGLRDIETTAQEQNIGQLNNIIEQKLDELDALRDKGKLGLESELALETMRDASRTWQQNWETVKQLRSANVWRADINFMDLHVRPVQRQVLRALADTESTIVRWSEQNTATVQQVANQISYVLWALSGLALIFVVLVYILMDRSVLSPIARIANALSTEGQTSNYQFEDKSSREISILVQAFNTMRQQVHQRQMALEHQAMHDALTGLPNRVLLQDRLEQAISIMRRNKQPMSLLLLDLDRFKEVNDALGHQIGDQLLQQVGQRLESILRDSDTIARLGGDEFAIVAPNTDAAQARKFADKVAAAINRVFFIQQQNLYVGVSIGVATYPDHGNDAMTLVRHADVAMYVAKRNNLDVFVYERQRDDHSLDRLALVGDLHDELKDPQHLQIYYQPLIDLLSREVVAIEALLRWNHPQMGFISPENIINMAEHTGLIGPLTQWVINTALRDCAECHFPSHNINISINLSAWNLQDPQLPSVIRSALDTYGQTASKLTLEITESAMMNDPVRARDVLSKLSDMGIDLAIDDFGTGFSSLGYLKMLPVDCLKIDKSFVIDMLENENDAIIVHSTIELAHNLGLQVIAEGVENQETLLRLRRLKCDLAQGYHISKPVPRDQFQKWLKNYNPKLAQSVQ